MFFHLKETREVAEMCTGTCPDCGTKLNADGNCKRFHHPQHPQETEGHPGGIPVPSQGDWRSQGDGFNSSPELITVPE